MTTYIDVRVTDVNVDCCHFKVPCFTITGAPLLFLSATVPLLVRLDARVWVLKRTSLARPSVPIRYVFSFSDDAYTVSPPAPPGPAPQPCDARQRTRTARPRRTPVTRARNSEKIILAVYSEQAVPPARLMKVCNGLEAVLPTPPRQGREVVRLKPKHPPGSHQILLV